MQSDCPPGRYPHTPPSTAFIWASLPCRTQYFPRSLPSPWSPAARACVYCVPHPFAPLYCTQLAFRSLSDPRGSPFRGPLLTSACLHRPPIHFPPCRPLPTSHSLPVLRGLRHVLLCPLSPFPLCICLALPVCCAVSCILLVIVVSSYVLLSKSKSPGRLHYLEIVHPGPCPCATWPCWKRSGYPPPPCIPPIPPPPLAIVITFLLIETSEA